MTTHGTGMLHKRGHGRGACCTILVTALTLLLAAAQSFAKPVTREHVIKAAGTSRQAQQVRVKRKATIAASKSAAQASIPPKADPKPIKDENGLGSVWYVKSNATGANDGTSWGDAFTGLQAGIDAASSADQVWVAAGTYAGQTFEMKDGVDLYGGFAGTETERNQRNWTAHVTTLDGEDARRVVTGADNARLDGFTITRGKSSQGGGMYNNGCSPVVENCTFTANRVTATGNPCAYTKGGAMYNRNCSPVIRHCTFQGNSASGVSWWSGNGGAIYNYEASVEITECTFSENWASTNSESANGGAICNSSSSPTIRNCVFSENRAIYGGGSFANTKGGAIYWYRGAGSVTNCTFNGNWAQKKDGSCRGGAIYFYSVSGPAVRNCIFWGDSAEDGPEIKVWSGTVTVSYCDIQGGYAGTGNIDANPAFLSAPDDLRLASSSPCIDAAHGDFAPAADKDGNARYDDPNVQNTGTGTPPYADMGAYERQGEAYPGIIGLNPTSFQAISYHGQNPPDDVFEVWRVGGDAVCYTITDDAAWLSCSPNSGISTGEHDAISVHYNVDGLAPGVHNATITVTDDNAENSPQTIQVILEVVAGDVIYVDAGATGANDGTSWTDAFTHVLDALAAATAGDEIWIAAATYKPGASRSDTFQMIEGVDICGGFAGTETQHDQRDWKVNETILSGDIGIQGSQSDNCYHVVTGANHARLDGITVTAGFANKSGECRGAGMYNVNVSPTVANCTFSSNKVDWDGSTCVAYGAGMFNSNSTATITNCTFTGNLAVGVNTGDGAGAYNAGGAPVFMDCVFSGNSTDGLGSGAGIYNSGSNARVVGCTFQSNFANYGGGVRNQGGVPTFENCLFFSNTAHGGNGGNGGGVKNVDSTVTFVNCTFTANQASPSGIICNGGAMSNYGSNVVAVRNCILWNNNASSGPDEIGGSGVSVVTYSCVDGGYDGEGNIAADPLFADAANNDYHLKSAAGRWTGSGWETDVESSPCLDVGTPTDDFSEEPAPDGGRVNMGAYGNTDQASKSLAIHHTVTATAGANGAVLPAGSVLVANGCDRTFQITPNAGYATDDVMVDDQSVGAVDSYTFTNVVGNHTIHASFCVGHRIQADCGSGGTISPSGELWVAHARNQTFDIAAEVGYAIGDVTVDGQSVGPVSQYQFLNVIADHTILVAFIPIPYLLTDKTVLSVYTFEGQDAANATFQIWNAGAAGNVQYTVTENAAWLVCNPESGLSSGEHDTITLSFSTSGLGEGVYAATVTAAAPNAQNSPISITVNLLVGSVLYVDADATGADNGMGWANAFTHLQDALTVAQSAHEIWVAEGTYKPTSGSSRYSYFGMKSGVEVYGGFAGHETERETRNWQTNETILSGDIGVQGNYNDNVYTVIRGADAAVLDGFTVELGNADSSSGGGGGDQGGGMYNSGCAPTVRNCTFRYNRATGYYGSGGGMYINGSALVDNCRFLDNVAGGLGYGYGGGGMIIEGGSPTITNCWFEGNIASGFNPYGGGINNSSASTVVRKCVFKANSAGDGGGIENWSNGNILIENCLFIDNIASRGSGVDNDAAGWGGNLATIKNSTFSNCGIRTMMDGHTTVVNTIVRGGGIIPSESGGGEVVTVSYSCVEGGCAGTGNIDQNPLFADAGNDDFHLTASSPCIDSADGSVAPDTDFDGNPRYDDPDMPNVGIGPPWTDMGAYEFPGPVRVLSVQSTPITGVLITGSLPGTSGTTNYVVADVAEGTEVTLTAPETVTDGSDEYVFVRWLVNDAPQPRGQTGVTINITADTTATAVYTLRGDFDGDGDIDDLDFAAFIEVYGLSEGDPGWDPNGPIGDFDDDDDVDFQDFMEFTDVYGI